MAGLYKRAVREAFIKLDPRTAVKNPVMFVVWLGTIVTLLVTLDPEFVWSHGCRLWRAAPPERDDYGHSVS